MNPSSNIAWEDRLVRLSLALLLLATAYGIVAGASISMYYDVTPNMGSLEDNLASAQIILYLLAVITSLSHLPMAIWDATRKLWRPASMRALVVIGQLIIFLGAEGLILHFLWWAPISETDRFHMLHHSHDGRRHLGWFCFSSSLRGRRNNWAHGATGYVAGGGLTPREADTRYPLEKRTPFAEQSG